MTWQNLASMLIAALTGGVVSLTVSMYLSTRSETRQALKDQYAEQKAVLARAEELMIDAYHGGLLADDVLRRKSEIMKLRQNVLFTFGDEQLANKLMGALFEFEAHNNDRPGWRMVSTDGPQPGRPMEDFIATHKRFTECEARMLKAIQETEKRLRLPSSKLTPATLGKLEAMAKKAAPQLKQKSVGAASAPDSMVALRHRSDHVVEVDPQPTSGIDTPPDDAADGEAGDPRGTDAADPRRNGDGDETA